MSLRKARLDAFPTGAAARRRIPSFPATWVAGLVAVVALTGPTPAQLPSGGSGGADRIEGRAKFLPIPYLGYDRALGVAVGFIPMVLFNPVAEDEVSPSSVAGVAGIYTENETWFLAGFTSLYLDEDRWRTTVAGGTGSVNFQFRLANPIDRWVPYNTAVDFASTSLERRVARDLFLGLTYNFSRFETGVPGAPSSAGTTLQGVGVTSSMDRRSSVYYPRGGFFSELEYTTFPDWMGNAAESDVVEFQFNHFLSARDTRDVVASRFFAGVGLGDLSFNQQLIVGGTDIRGYTQGAFRGNTVLAAQSEYRWNPWERVGFVGFVGAATVLDALNEADDGRFLPGAGVGLRFTADLETHMNVGLDVAAGDDDWGVYFRIGEAY